MLACISFAALAGTSKPREWGKGRVTRNPGRAQDKEYYKRDFAPRAAWDPRPSCFQNNEPFTSKELEDFHKSVQLSLRRTGEDCPFIKHIPLQYPDFDFDEETMEDMKLNQLIDIFYDEFNDNFNTGYFTPSPSEKDNQLRCEPFLFKGTQEQSDSDTWKRLRSVMITASTAKTVLSLKSPEAKKNFLKRHLWQMNQVTTKAMQYGINNEEKARKRYTRIVTAEYDKTTVEVTGLWGNPIAPFIGCSPDGIVTSGDGDKWLLEIKCLWILRDKNPKLFEKILTKEQLSRFPLRRLPNNELELKKNHSHYYQVQMAMDVLDLEECDYFIWSQKGHLLVPVVRDREFGQSKHQRLVDIHYTLLIPEYFLKRTPRNLDPV
ncbi:Exonuclease [Frankliniella fusca]|uniref:Exonuclease n=1 Tax=Frankliniella fusca TaxID=407009 RepID=A0AAE1HXL0_9NEOP|nr:Exonuclease [Frankliniella fusca]